MPDKIKEFFDKVVEQRKHQADRWADGTEEGLDAIDDAHNGANDFALLISRCAMLPRTLSPEGRDSLEDFRGQMVKVATLAYAAHRWADRRITDIDDAEAALQRGVSGDEAA